MFLILYSEYYFFFKVLVTTKFHIDKEGRYISGAICKGL